MIDILGVCICMYIWNISYDDSHCYDYHDHDNTKPQNIIQNFKKQSKSKKNRREPKTSNKSSNKYQFNIKILNVQY